MKTIMIQKVMTLVTSDAFEDSNETVNDIGYENFPDSFQSKE